MNSSSYINQVPKIVYIELNSTYRNRNLYSNPAQFEVNVSNSGQKDSGITAYDPLCNAQPIESFQTGIIEAETGTMGGVPSAPILTGITTSYSLVGSMIQDDTTTEQSIITSYNSFTNQIEVEPQFSDAWTVGDSFSFIDLSTDSNIFFAGGPSGPEDKYVGQLLYNITTQQYRTITSYKDNILTVDSDFTGRGATDEYQIQSTRHITTDTVGGGGTIASGAVTNTTVTLAASASSIDNFYVGNFIRLIEDLNKPPFGPEVSAVITSYNGTTKVATVAYMNLTSFDTSATLLYFIFPFTSDNASFLNYVGFEENRRVLYRISLNSLILPNQTLDNTNGGRIVNYPYVYVVFKNKSGGTTSLINSNNPNSRRAVFRVSINDVPDPTLASFIKLESDMVNIYEFNPYEDISFEVYLSDGTLFKTVMDDTISPELPNQAIQISANFALERIK